MDSIPIEILIKIFKKLSAADAVSLGEASRRLNFVFEKYIVGKFLYGIFFDGESKFFKLGHKQELLADLPKPHGPVIKWFEMGDRLVVFTRDRVDIFRASIRVGYRSSTRIKNVFKVSADAFCILEDNENQLLLCDITRIRLPLRNYAIKHGPENWLELEYNFRVFVREYFLICMSEKRIRAQKIATNIPFFEFKSECGEIFKEPTFFHDICFLSGGKRFWIASQCKSTSLGFYLFSAEKIITKPHGSDRICPEFLTKISIAECSPYFHCRLLCAQDVILALIPPEQFPTCKKIWFTSNINTLVYACNLTPRTILVLTRFAKRFFVTLYDCEKFEKKFIHGSNHKPRIILIFGDYWALVVKNKILYYNRSRCLKIDGFNKTKDGAPAIGLYCTPIEGRS